LLLVRGRELWMLAEQELALLVVVVVVVGGQCGA
jgi:hypothetical protein